MLIENNRGFFLSVKKETQFLQTSLPGDFQKRVFLLRLHFLRNFKVLSK